MTSCGKEGRGSIPGRGRDVSLRHHFQTGSGAHSASYQMRTKSREDDASSWLLASI